MNVHNVAQTGFGDGTNDHYDKSRPSYPSEALSYIKSALGSKESLKVAELGSGTGLFTRAFLAHPEWNDSISEIRAIEPSEGMRKTFAARTSDPRATTHDGTFEHTALPDSWADLVIIAQAFHWCPNYDAACAEFARILKPGGSVVFIWNLEDRDGAPWVAQIRDVYEAHEKGTPQFRLGLWRQAFDTPSYKAAFGAPEEKHWAYALHGSLDIVLNRAFSKSYMTMLSDEEKVAAKKELTDIIQRGEGQVKTNEAGTEFEYPYKTFVVLAKKQ